MRGRRGFKRVEIGTKVNMSSEKFDIIIAFNERKEQTI